ncbi:lipocalin/fatty-acid binding family protein [Kitasatospora sp. NPDC001095]
MTMLGKWEMTSSDNYGEYLKAVGVGMIQRNLAEKAVPTEELTLDGYQHTLLISTALKNQTMTFSLGVEFDETTVDGRASKTSFTRDGNKLIQVQKIGGESSTTIRTYGEAEMTATYSAKGVTATRVFKRL